MQITGLVAVNPEGYYSYISLVAGTRALAGERGASATFTSSPTQVHQVTHLLPEGTTGQYRYTGIQVLTRWDTKN